MVREAGTNLGTDLFREDKMSTILDIEFTLNRFGWCWIQPNKLQLGPLRIAWWAGRKFAIGFEINWQRGSV